MSTKPTPSTALAVVEQTFQEIDEFAKSNTLATITEGRGNMMASLALAQGIEWLQSKLTDEVMKPLMRLQGSPLGFRSDRDKNKDGTKGPGYDMETVRDVMIDMTIKGGFLLFGNEVNIIASRGYITKEGFQGAFKRRAKDGLCTYPEVTVGTPKQVGDGFLVVCSAKCFVGEGSKQVIQINNAEIPVKGQSLDQVIGKATRKILSRLYERVTGVAVTDGDLNEGAIDVTATNVTGTASAPVADPLDAETLEALTKLIGEHGEKATAFFLENGNITAGQTWENVKPTVAKRALSNTKGFLQAIGVTK